jgi:hypothetical protein
MSQARTPLPHPLCRNLDSKKLQMLGAASVVCAEDLQTAGYENYWCRKTFTDTGPDGGWVRYEGCGPNRGCYQSSEDATPGGTS